MFYLITSWYNLMKMTELLRDDHVKLEISDLLSIARHIFMEDIMG